MRLNTNEKQQKSAEEQDQKQVRYNLDSLIRVHDSVKLLYQQRLDDRTFSTTEEHYDYEYIKNCIHAAAKETLAEYEKQSKKQERQKPYWWDEDIEREIAEKRQKYLKFLNTNKDSDKRQYKEAQASVRKKITQKITHEKKVVIK